MKANFKQAMEEMKRQREILRKRKEEEKAAKVKERQNDNQQWLQSAQSRLQVKEG